MTVIKNIYTSQELNVLLIRSEYKTSYSLNDFNPFYCISFPMQSCYHYMAGSAQFLLDSNHNLFEKEHTEFRIAKLSLVKKDVTICIQLKKIPETYCAFFSRTKQTVLQTRKVETEVLLRKLLYCSSHNNIVFKEQVLIDILNSIETDKITIANETVSTPYNVLKIEDAKSFMHAHYQKPLRIEDIASIACLSIYHFSRQFRHITGYSPYGYLMLLRVEKAKKLLCEGCPVEETAFSTGFNSLENFSYAFKKITSHAPSAYKK
jgi:AraC-like DNA-binding protein